MSNRVDFWMEGGLLWAALFRLLYDFDCFSNHSFSLKVNKNQFIRTVLLISIYSMYKLNSTFLLTVVADNEQKIKGMVKPMRYEWHCRVWCKFPCDKDYFWSLVWKFTTCWHSIEVHLELINMKKSKHGHTFSNIGHSYIKKINYFLTDALSNLNLTFSHLYILPWLAIITIMP